MADGTHDGDGIPQMDAPQGGVRWRDADLWHWVQRGIWAVFVLMALGVVLATNSFLTERFTETTRNRAEVRQALYTGQLLSELQRTSVVPLLLARDPELIKALLDEHYALTSARLISAQADIGASAIQLLDRTGRVVVATARIHI